MAFLWEKIIVTVFSMLIIKIWTAEATPTDLTVISHLTDEKYNQHEGRYRIENMHATTCNAGYVVPYKECYTTTLCHTTLV